MGPNTAIGNKTLSTSTLSDSTIVRMTFRGGCIVAAETLPLPRASAYDPPLADEGRLDPLGLSSIADRIADTYARPLRARMRRVRFLTTMSLGGLFINDLAGVEPAVAGDTADVALERVVIECLARASGGEVQLDTGIPGITKAHASLLAKSRLTTRGYLKSPRVFGFFGVYRPLATALGLSDSHGGTLEAGIGVLAGLQGDLGINGLTDFAPGSEGARLIDWLTQETGKALETGVNGFNPRSPFVDVITKIANPGNAGKNEKQALRNLLANPMPSTYPMDEETYGEILVLLSEVDSEPWTEPETVAYLLREGSEALRIRMQLLVDFEDFARDLTWAFNEYRYIASHAYGGVPSQSAIGAEGGIDQVAQRIAQRYRDALSRMHQAIEFGVDPALAARFSESFGQFAEVSSTAEFLDLLMEHHSMVQKSKAPNGKRPWLEATNTGWAVRPLFTLADAPERLEGFVHPYRLRAMTNFLVDVRD